jgi:hypothetical protein
MIKAHIGDRVRAEIFRPTNAAQSSNRHARWRGEPCRCARRPRLALRSLGACNNDLRCVIQLHTERRIIPRRVNKCRYRELSAATRRLGGRLKEEIKCSIRPKVSDRAALRACEPQWRPLCNLRQRARALSCRLASVAALSRVMSPQP